MHEVPYASFARRPHEPRGSFDVDFGVTRRVGGGVNDRVDITDCHANALAG
jgi:hypothetical protein